MIKDRDYFVVQSFMIKDLKLSGNNMIIYAIIYRYCQIEGQYFNESLSYLAELANCSKPTVISSLKKLIELGYIVKREFYENNIKYCKYSCVPLEEIKAKKLENETWRGSEDD